ncbi:MAG: hypothetical protein JW819_13090 [Candidatus Krumholzibacteriota bacterium]|nr:hypothetical protein [Candidatus Krumholzibacteriota bacterium]
MPSSTSSSDGAWRMAGTVLGWAARKLGFAAATLALAVLLGEVFMHLFMLPTMRYDPDPELHTVYRPSQRAITWQGNYSIPTPPFTINSDGNRGAETDWTRPVILVLGNSEVFGPGLRDHETWCHVLQTRLDAAGAAPGFEVVNGGHGGYGPYHHAVYFERILSRHPVHTAIVQVTTGDRIFHRPAGPAASGGLYAFIRDNLYFVRYLVNKAKAQKASLRRALVPLWSRERPDTSDPEFLAAAEGMWAEHEGNWRRIVEAGAGRGVRVVFLVINPLRRKGDTLLYERLAAWARERENVHALELGPPAYGLGDVPDERLEAVYRERLTLGFDLHANPERHRLVAEAVYAFLKGL